MSGNGRSPLPRRGPILEPVGEPGSHLGLVMSGLQIFPRAGLGSSVPLPRNYASAAELSDGSWRSSPWLTTTPPPRLLLAAAVRRVAQHSSSQRRRPRPILAAEPDPVLDRLMRIPDAGKRHEDWLIVAYSGAFPPAWGGYPVVGRPRKPAMSAGRTCTCIFRRRMPRMKRGISSAINRRSLRLRLVTPE